MQKIGKWIKSEMVMCVSLVLALGSMLVVRPDRAYADYIDFRTLGILLSLMLVVAGLRGLGVFAAIGRWLIAKTNTAKGLALVFVCLNFFLSMVITNDVALLTFVPFAIEVLVMAQLEKYMIRLVVLETIAANLGSMLTPLGNPQNLFLYAGNHMSLGAFVKIMLPYSMAAFVLLVITTCLCIGKDTAKSDCTTSTVPKNPKWVLQLLGYLLLFVVCMLTVLRILPFYITLAIVIAGVLLLDWRNLTKADYGLLFTFVFLFVFVGNLGRIPAISSCLASLTTGNEVSVAVLTSQVISNVPATILLAGFTDNTCDLIIGVNIGGLGTLIASMASLISFKCYCRQDHAKAGKYLGIFTLFNVLYLLALLGLYYVLSK